MKQFLQKFDFRSSGYQRPNQIWICGRQSDGRPCQIGPDAGGTCRSDFECRPVKRNDRWQCTRSEFSGGRCEHGPFPDGTCCRPVPRCQPVMSWRSRPGAVGRRIATLTFGLLLILVAGAFAPRFLNPGPLTFQHAHVNDCRSCHSAFAKGPIAWAHAAFAENTTIDDSKRCLACHNLGRDGLRPHSLPPLMLEGLTRNAGKPSPGSLPMILEVSTTVFPRPGMANAQLPCNTCHREHFGTSFDLRAMPNARCQTCHSTRFTSLGDGHPEFDKFPFKRRTRIVFDHAGHFGKHFRDPAVRNHAPTACKSCHIPDVNGRTMLVESFEATCAACHGAQVEGAGRATAKGLGVISVPGLDVATLAKRGIAIGEWPEDADNALTPFMNFLFSGDKDYRAVKEVLAGLDLLDLSRASDAEIAAVNNFAWLVKDFLFEIAVEGVPALKARLEKALGRRLDNRNMASLSGLLPADTVREAQRQWFPRLLQEVSQHRQGQQVPMPSKQASAVGKGRKVLPAGGSKDGGDLLAVDKKDGGDLLAGDKKDGDLLASDKKDGGDLLIGDKAPDTSAPPAAKVTAEKSPAMASGEEWSVAGGWYRDYFTLRYRPTGHDDRFLKAWLDVTGSNVASAAEAGRNIFDALADAKAPGLCGKCHSIDAQADGMLIVNWTGRRPLPNDRAFTTYSHAAHFSLLDEKGCLTCHGFAAGAEYLAGFKDRNPLTFASNFKAIDRQVCAACHTKKVAGDACLNCHNYHIGSFPPAMASMPLTTTIQGN